jgi:sulfur carrier protein ThiS
MQNPQPAEENKNSSPAEDRSFMEFRRKVRDAELLSSSMEHLLRALHFSGRLMVVVQNGQVLKSGYEEGYFRRRNEVPLLS